jgi:uncharacterized protein DUF3892
VALVNNIPTLASRLNGLSIANVAASSHSYDLNSRQCARWKLTQDKAIAYIQDGTHVFYIEKPGGLWLDVIVATSEHGNYLKTVADREQPDKLLYLPSCP